MLAEIAVATFTQKYRELYTYQVPIEMESSLQIGMGVLVRFGPRVLDGIVFKLNHETSTRKLNPILRLVKPQPVLSSWQIALVDFISSYYAASLHAAIQTVSPFAFKDLPTPKPERVISFKAAATPDNKLGPKAKQLLELLARLQSIPYHELTQTHAFGAATIKSLVTAGLAAASEQLSTRAKLTLPAAEPPFVLTAGQQQIFDQIKVDMQRQPSKFLLMGVTNSGKTEIYLQTIATLIQQGGSAIMLVPEIALTPQTVGRFERRFPGQVALWHSLLTPTQRARTYRQIQNGEIKVVIGSRSALFSPLPDLKLIVIDEEHEISYKQEQNPRYHARLVAEKISSLRGASLILGSATPAVESYAKAQNGEYTLLELPLTINQQTIASTVSTVDLRDELMANNRTTLSKALQTAIADNLSKGEQTILFLNRRGKSTCVLCRECGFVYKCPHCDLPLTLHADGNHAELICHHCGFKQQPDSACPRCGGNKIRYLGAGTQKVVEDLARQFPSARVMRLDADSINAEFTYDQVYAQLLHHEVDIVIGTQVIAKGWDLPKVSLVGVLLADQSLYFPDFSAGERTYALLTQVIGRAGRGDLPGRVIIQTYNPEDVYLQLTLKRNPVEFYQFELAQRAKHGFPPFSHIIKLEKAFPTYTKGQTEATQLATKLKTAIAAIPVKMDVLGPMPSFIQKRQAEYYWQIVLQGDNFAPLMAQLPVEWSIDVDPLDLL